MILITSADDYLGYCITSHLSQFVSLCSDMRVLCQEKNDKQPWLCNFAKKGIQVFPVNYTHPNDLSIAMRNVDQIILVMSNHPDRVAHCQNVCNVASRSNVKSIIFLSHQGAQSEHHEALHDYGLVENHLVSMQRQDINWVILRLDFIQQYFHLWSTQVEISANMALPLNSYTELCPIDISDVCAVVSTFVTSYPSDYHAGQVYTLTGAESVTCKSIVEMMSNATSYKLHRYLRVRPMDTVYYLKELPRNIWFDARLKKERAAAYIDQNEYSYRPKILCSPNDIQIQTFIDYFDWVNTTLGSVHVDHTELITKEKPRTLQAYFNENSVNFKPRV